jgi:hypothetical protein
MIELQRADHPGNVTELSDDHSINMKPVGDVTGLGIVDPEYLPSWVVSVQAMLVQLLTVT